MTRSAGVAAQGFRGFLAIELPSVTRKNLAQGIRVLQEADRVRAGDHGDTADRGRAGDHGDTADRGRAGDHGDAGDGGRAGRGSRLRWVRPEGLHLTLRFLGPTDVAVVPGLLEDLTRRLAAQPPFSVEVRGLGAFPRADRAQVLWAGVTDPEGYLAALAAATEAAARASGFAPETRDFTPHITLARARGRAVGVMDLLEGGPPTVFGPMSVGQVILFESRLQQTQHQPRPQPQDEIAHHMQRQTHHHTSDSLTDDQAGHRAGTRYIARARVPLSVNASATANPDSKNPQGDNHGSI